MEQTKLNLNETYAQLASDEQIENAAQALQTNGFRVLIAANGAEAKDLLFQLIPEGAEVFTSSSATLNTLDIPAEVDQRYDSVRVKLAAMDRDTQGR